MINKIINTLSFLLMIGMYSLLGAEVAYTVTLPSMDGGDVSCVLIAVLCAFLSTAVFIMMVKGSKDE